MRCTKFLEWKKIIVIALLEKKPGDLEGIVCKVIQQYI
jgi:hypothetical protein